MAGRISLLVSKDLRTAIEASKTLEPEVRKQVRAGLRRMAEPAFKQETVERAETRLEQRVIGSTTRVAVSDSNVTLKAATIGTVGAKKTKAYLLAGGAEFGMNPGKQVTQRSSKGKKYTRRIGSTFRPNRRSGYVFFPAVQAFIPRAGALLFQTVYRTVAETFEKGAR